MKSRTREIHFRTLDNKDKVYNFTTSGIDQFSKDICLEDSHYIVILEDETILITHDQFKMIRFISRQKPKEGIYIVAVEYGNMEFILNYLSLFHEVKLSKANFFSN
jgi:hypothetical protein